MITSFEVPALISAERTALLPRREALSIFEMDIRSDPRWEQFVSAHPDALIYHHPGWLSALESEYGQKCVSLACTDEFGRLYAVLPLFYTQRPAFEIRRYCDWPAPFISPANTDCRPVGSEPQGGCSDRRVRRRNGALSIGRSTGNQEPDTRSP